MPNAQSNIENRGKPAMIARRKLTATFNQAWAKRLAVASLLICSIIFLLQVKDNQIAQVVLSSSREELYDKHRECSDLEARLTRREKQYLGIIADIAKQVDQEHQLHLTMAEVLSRVKILQGEQDHFQEVDKELRSRFAKIDHEYMQIASEGDTSPIR